MATVAGGEITAEALRAELRRRFRAVPDGELTADHKLAAIEILIRSEAIYAQAQAKGFDRTPEMQARIKQLVIAEFKERAFAAANHTATEQDVELFYQANAERYAQPAAVRGAAIFVAVPATAAPEKRAEFRARAEALLTEARAASDDTTFARMAGRHSDDQATRYRGGDLGWLASGAADVEPALMEALSALQKPGDYAPLVQVPRGFYIAKLLEKRDATRKPLAEVREAIRYQLSREQAAQAERQFHQSMKAGLEITVNRELLESISVPLPKDEPPRTPGSTTAQLR